MTDIIFKGPISKLKGTYYQDSNTSAPTVVLLYPESRNTESPIIVNEIIKILKDNNLSVFAFNFKKLEPISATEFDKKELELYEVIAVLNWLNEKNQDNKNIWLISLFSTVPTGLQLVMRRPEIQEYFLFSPPAKMKDFSFIVPCSSTGIILYESGVETSALDIIEKMVNKNESCISHVAFDDTNFERNENLAPTLEYFDNYIKQRLIEDSGKIKKVKRDRRRRKKKKSGSDEIKNIHVNPIKELDFDF